MYFNEKEDTNIDKQFNGTKANLSKYKMPLIISGIVLLLLLIIVIFIILSRRPKYYISLIGGQDITIYQGVEYIDPGFNAYDNKKNNLNNSVITSGTVNSEETGKYTITYSLKNVTVKRIINVIEGPANETTIHLNGDVIMYLNVNSEYTEPGYSAVDFKDGDLTSSVEISGEVDATKEGTYKLTYTVVNSAGITTSVVRTVIVK